MTKYVTVPVDVIQRLKNVRGSPYIRNDELIAAVDTLINSAAPASTAQPESAEREALEADLAWHKEALKQNASKLQAVWEEVNQLRAITAPQDAQERDKRDTGYIAPKGRYVPPVLFSPYTGEPRDARDIQSDPQGILIVPPGALLAATQPSGEKQ